MIDENGDHFVEASMCHWTSYSGTVGLHQKHTYAALADIT